MSTVSFSSSQIFRPCDSSECDEEGSCSDGGDIAGCEYLSSKCSGSIDFDQESEAAMSESDECVDAKISASFRFRAGAADCQAQKGVHRQPQQHANLVWADPSVSESSWTDEKHSLYLNSIEEAFVRSLHERGHYTHSCERRKTQRIIPCMSDKGLYRDEEVESEISCDYQPILSPEENGAETQRCCNHEDIQNRTKRSRLEDTCIKQSGLQEDMNAHQTYITSGKANNCLKDPLGEETTEEGALSNESSPEIRMQCFKDTSEHGHEGRHTETSEPYMQEDQVVPSMENFS